MVSMSATTTAMSLEDMSYMAAEASSLGISLSTLNRMLALAAVYDPVINRVVEGMPDTCPPRDVGERVPVNARKQHAVALRVGPYTVNKARRQGSRSIGEAVRRALISYREYRSGGSSPEVAGAFGRLESLAGGLDRMESLEIQKSRETSEERKAGI